MISLTELQHDALVEIFNQGVGKAAAAMSQIVNEEVKMSFPSILFQTRAEAARSLGSIEARRVCAVTQHYVGAFNTEAILMFPEEKSLEIVRLMVGQSLSAAELSEMEQEAMNEIGNIVLNCCMGTLANVTGQEMQGSLPLYRLGTGDEILGLSVDSWNGMVLTLKIDFHVEKHAVAGYLALLLGTAALADLPKFLDRYLTGLTQ